MNKYYKKWYEKKENREKRLVYLKEWRKKNRERIKEYSQEYYTKKVVKETMDGNKFRSETKESPGGS